MGLDELDLHKCYLIFQPKELFLNVQMKKFPIKNDPGERRGWEMEMSQM